MTTATTTILVVVVVSTVLTTAIASPIPGIDSLLSHQSRLDPQATSDSFLSLPSSLKNSLSLSLHPPPNHGLLPPLSLQLSVPITVKLMGPSSSPSLLSSFLSAAVSSDHFHIITPFLHPHHRRLALSHSLHLDASLSSPSPSTHLVETLASELSKATSSLRSPLTSIPYSVVDQIGLREGETRQGVYIDLLNLGSQSKPYAYNYGHGDSSPSFTKCLGNVWSGKDRYVWIDLKLIERTFMDEVNNGGLLLGDQSLRFCSFAISRSITSYTSSDLFDNYTMIVSEYLDSKRLHQTLLESADELRRLAKLPEEDFGRVLPVYVFDLDLDMILLLDRYHQSVAFKDMVIAVRTKNTQTLSDYSCNGRHVLTQMRELERPIVGSILQSMWGVSPTHPPVMEP